MNQLLAIQDILSNGYTVEFLDVLSIIALIFGITVITNKNPIASLLSLIGLFASISVYLILSGLTFIVVCMFVDPTQEGAVSATGSCG